ncbi:hypothetical protein HID58_028868, partial [Brassica napus]
SGDAQKLELSRSVTHNSESLSRWEAPKEDFVKCNVGVSWSKRNSLLGASWIVCNEHGECLIHSRRTFGNVNSLADGSVTMEMRYQSYVARGVPGWLCDMLE